MHILELLVLSLFYLRINPFGDNNRLLPRVNSLDMFMCDVQSLYRMNRRFFSRLYGSCISLYDIRILLMFQNVTYKFLISLRLYQFIFSVIYKFFISRCDTLILLFFVWCINTVFLNDTHQSYFCV